MKSDRLFLLSFFLLAVFSTRLSAQDETIRVETSLVTLNVSVTDKKGDFVKNLTKEDFQIFDGARKQSIDEFSAENSPVYYGIVYDLHPTTGERTANVLEALRGWTKTLKPDDNFFVTVFNERGSLTTDFVPGADQIERHLSETKPSSPNSLYDAIFAASEKVRERRNAKKVLVVLTDGEDHNSHHSLKELRLHLGRVNLPIFTVAFHDENRREWGYTDLHRADRRRTLAAAETSQLSAAALADLSKTSGGQSFDREIENRYYLNAIFNKVRQEVENQYVVGFYPDALDGKWHRLKVSVRAPAGRKYKTSNRKGYTSPAKTVKSE